MFNPHPLQSVDRWLTRRDRQRPLGVLFSALATGLLLVAAGCGGRSGPEKVEVSGMVVFDGEPITNGEILFYPMEGTPGSVAGGPIKDGKYLAQSRGGVPVGKHRVEIRGFQSPSRPGRGDLAVEGGPAEQYVPPEFNTRSTLTAQIDSSTTTKDFDLSSK